MFRLLVVLLLLGTCLPLSAEQSIEDKDAREMLNKNESLATVVALASDKYAEAAWQRMRFRAWKEGEYVVIISSGREPYAGRAWEQLQAQTKLPEVPILLGILEYRNSSTLYYEVRACERLEKFEVSREQLIRVIRSGDEPCQDRAYERLLSQRPNLEELWRVSIGSRNQSTASKASSEIWGLPLAPQDLAWLVIRDRSDPGNDRWWRGRAWRRLLAQGAPSEALVSIIEDSGEYAPRAWDILYLRGPSNDELRRIMASNRLPKDFRLEVGEMLAKRLP